MRAFFANTILFIKRAKVALFGVNPLTGIKLTFFVAAIALGVLAIAHPALADGKGSVGGDIADWLVTGVTDILLVTARLAIGICIFFLHLFITLASYNNYINTPVVQVGWIMVRDVANMFFVVTLLVIAFGTILGLEQYEWKKGLVKLILGAIFINFSNLLAQLIIDVAHVFTITFLNAIAAAAGGNLLQMFHLTEILSFVQKPKSTDVSNVRLELLGGAIMAVIFAIFSAVAMGAYVVAMMARVVLLWVLIIMSPLAFIWQVLPATQGYAERWWKEFKEQVLVAPIMVFFLWLTFATLGTGTVIRDIQDGEGGKSNVIPLQNEASDEVAVSISKVSSWERMASFLVAIAFLFIGIKEVGETGAVGSRIIGSAVDFGKKVATVATGYAAGRWLVGKGADAAKATAMAPLKGAGWLAKKGAWHIAGKHIVNKAKTTYAAAADKYYKKGGEMSAKGYDLRNQAGAKTAELVKEKKLLDEETDPEKRKERAATVEKLDTEIGEIEQQMQSEYRGGILGKSARRGIQYEKQLAKTEKQMENSKKLLWKSVGSEAGGKVLFGMGVGTGSRGLGFVPFQDKIEDALKKGLTGFADRGTRTEMIKDLDAKIAEKKAKGGDTSRLVKKREKLEEERKESGEYGGIRKFARWAGKRANFFRLGGDQFEFDEELAKSVYGEKGITAKDRVERGWLKAEEARSAAKDDEFESLGEKQALYRPRAKYDVKNGKFGWQVGQGGMMDQIARHKVGAEVHQEAVKLANSQARMKIVAEFDATTKQQMDLNTKKAELGKKLEDADALTEDGLKHQVGELKDRVGGIDFEQARKKEELKEAREAFGTEEERAKKMAELDDAIAKAGGADANTEESKKAVAKKEEFEVQKKKESSKIEEIETHIASLDEEKKAILGTDDEPGALALLEAELKDIEAIIAGGDDKITERLGEIDGTIAAEKEEMKTAQDGVGDLAQRRQKAEAELEDARKKDEARAGAIQKTIDELEEIEKQGGNKGKRAGRQLRGEEAVSLMLDGKRITVQKDLYKYKKGQTVAEKEKEVEKLKKDEAAAKQAADDKTATSRSNLEQQERMKDALEKAKKKDANWNMGYTVEIAARKDRLNGAEDEKTKAELKTAEDRLAYVQGGVVDPAGLDDAAKAERTKRLQEVRGQVAQPIAAQLSQVKTQEAALKAKAKKLPSGVTYKDLLTTKSEAGHLAHILEQDEDRLFHALEQKEYRAALDLDQMSQEVSRGKFDKKGKEMEEQRKVLQTQFDEKRAKGTVGTLDQQRLELERQRKEASDNLAEIERPLKQIESEIKKMEEMEKNLTAELGKDGTAADRKKEIEKALEKLATTKGEKEAELRKINTDSPQEKRDALRAEIKQKDDDIIKKRTEISSAEKDMRKSDPAYARLERQLKDQDKKMAEVKDEDWKKQGERLRNGDMSVVNNVISNIDEQIADAKKAKDGEEVKRLTKEKEKWEEFRHGDGHHLKHASLAWRYGVSAAKKEDTAKGYKYAHNLLLSESEQRAIFDPRGLDTPKTTLTELIEQYSKNFGEMSIDSFVANVGPMLTSMIKKKKAGTLTEQDKAALMGLFKRGMDRSWLDDAIYAIRGNKEANEMIGEELGWKDNEYTDDKIRDIQMLFATADVDFVKKNAAMSYFQDVAVNDFKMSEADTFEGIKTGSFKNSAGADITAEFKEKMNKLMDANSFDQTDEHKQLFDSIFASTMTQDKQALEEMQKFRTRALNDYLETTRQNQSEFQFLGNLRTDALKSGHVENAGYALAREVGGGESLYMGMGVRSARNHVMGDARKMDLRNRAGMQSHSFAYLDENNGQVLTQVHQDKFADLMNGIDPRTWNAVNPRMRVHMMGLSSKDKFGDYRDDDDDSFYVSRLAHKDGTQTNAAKTWHTKLSGDSRFSKAWGEAKTGQQQEALVATAQMNNIFGPEMRGNMSAFVMAAAEASGGNATNAAMDGNINFKIFNPKYQGGAPKLYQNVNQLIADYNKGDWNLNGTLPPVPINNFIPTDPANRAKVKATMDDLL